MIHIKEAIVVEGKYDHMRLAGLVDALIVETGGFDIFSQREKLNMLRRLAKARGLLILTDSDTAGFRIRRFLTGAIDPALIKHAYIPDLPGKEPRKAAPSKEGKLGVEGVPNEILLRALEQAGVLCQEDDAPPRQQITKLDLFQAGLSGRDNSAQLRGQLLKRLELPEHLTANALLPVLNAVCTYEEFQQLTQDLKMCQTT